MEYLTAEQEAYRGKTSRGLRRMAQNMEKLGGFHCEMARSYRAFADRMDAAPRHGKEACMAYVISGNCHYC